MSWYQKVNLFLYHKKLSSVVALSIVLGFAAGQTFSVARVIFGCLPMLLAAKCGLQADHPPTQSSKRKWKNVILAFLLNFGGGILSANAFYAGWVPVDSKNVYFLIQ